MRGKAIDQVTVQDLTQLVDDGVAEDRRIEFKADVPVSAEEQKAQLKLNPAARPVDRSWTHGRSLAKFGRDALAEEVVAFANADGGTLILGMGETDEAPPRAKGINPLPDVAGLERRLRDILAACIEPRLPYVAVRALPTTADGSGVILIETGPSVLGPHWVTTTRKPTIRREDRCDPLLMPEVHDMVLRHARHVDTFLSRSDAERTAFVQAFAAYIRSKKPDNYMGEDSRIIEVWLRETGQAALGAQVTLTPHFDLAIPRLESMAGLVPSSNAISLVANPQSRTTYYVDVYSYASSNAAKVLGGVKAEQSGGFDKSVRVMRDGRVTVSFMQIRNLQACTCSADLIIGASGFALGIYDRLRRRSSYPAAPADLTLDICTRGHVGVGDYEGVGPHGSYGRLAEHTPFPSYTLGDERLKVTLAALLNLIRLLAAELVAGKHRENIDTIEHAIRHKLSRSPVHDYSSEEIADGLHYAQTLIEPVLTRVREQARAAAQSSSTEELSTSEVSTELQISGVIPACVDHHLCAHWRSPRDMMRQGSSTRLFQASQQCPTMSS